ncbi:NRX2A protein, partial [Buphagus erythrorhynchus]|nr:NRX2A protein [Buphagus erythrorhynchus]
HLGSQDHVVETEAHLGSVASQNFVGKQDHPEAGAGGGSVALLDSKMCQGSEEHLGPGASQVPVTHLASVPTQHHLDMKEHQESVASPGSVGDQDHPEPSTHPPLDSKVTRGSVARSGLNGHQDPSPCQASEDPQEPKVTQGLVANQKAKVNQSPAAPLEAKGNEDPEVCSDLRVHQAPVANPAPVGHQDSHADPQEPKDKHGPLDPRVPQDTKGGSECHRPPVPTWATAAPRPLARVPSGAHLGLVLVTLGSLLLPFARGSALEFGGAPGQWARYGRWAPGTGAQLSFRLKTNVTRALLLYLDDGGNCDFLELLVAEGRLRLRFAIACAEPATLEPPVAVSDGRW